MNVYCPLGTFCIVALNTSKPLSEAFTLIVYAPDATEDEGFNHTINGILGVSIDTFVITSRDVTTVMRVSGTHGKVIIKRTATAIINNA